MSQQRSTVEDVADQITCATCGLRVREYVAVDAAMTLQTDGTRESIGLYEMLPCGHQVDLVVTGLPT